MMTRTWRFASMLVALVLTLAVVPGAVAQCGLPTKLVKPSSWNPQVGAAHWIRSAM